MTGLGLLRAARGRACWSGRRPSAGRRDGWVLVACDVGQGDALVLHAGPGTGVVVDAGPDPAAVDRCLDRLGVERRAAAGAHPLPRRPRRRDRAACSTAAGRRRRDDPAARPARRGARGRRGGRSARARAARRDVRRDPHGRRRDPPGALAAARLADRRPGRRQHGQRGERGAAGRGARGPDAAHRRRRARGPGRAGPAAARAARRRAQDAAPRQPLPGPTWLLSLDAAVALVSVGADNDYGHPAAGRAAAAGRDGGAEVLRTDQDGDLAVVAAATAGCGVGHQSGDVGGLWQAVRTMAGPAHRAQQTSSAGSRWSPARRSSSASAPSPRSARRCAARPGGRALRDPGVRADPGHLRRAGRAVAVSARCAAWWSAAWRTCPTSRSTDCSTTPRRPPRTSRWCWCTPVAPRAAGC